MARVTQHPWFGPKRLVGWGWSPRSWEGWAASGLFFVALVLVLELMTGVGRVAAAIALLVALAVLMFVTGDPPGRPGSE